MGDTCWEEIWEGRVEEVHDGSFTAVLISRSGVTPRTVSAVISTDRVPSDDRYALVPGALFVWQLARRETDEGHSWCDRLLLEAIHPGALLS